MPFSLTLHNQNQRTQPNPLRVLLTNGRFPVSIDLARQLKRDGHKVYVVDPMEYHVCKFSNSVKKSYYVSSPHVDADGYIAGVRKAVDQSKIDLIIPLHEEVLYLAKGNDDEIKKRLFAPDFITLLRLHNKWEFYKLLGQAGLDRPKTWLCKTREAFSDLDLSKEYALKPVFGRAKSGVHHYKPSEPIPADLPVGEDNHYVAQEWLTGTAYCSYAVVRKGKIQAFAVYPVTETIDGSSCVYFEAIDHPRIKVYVDQLTSYLGDKANGQVALDFIETLGDNSRLVAIECNPRATSGIHLYSRTRHLASALVDPEHDPPAIARIGRRRQVAPGMLMWDKKDVTFKRYVEHMKRIMTSRDVVFTTHDILPSLMQPFLLTSYYQICRERKLALPEMFQWDLTWEPKGEELEMARRLIEEEGAKDSKERERDVAEKDQAVAGDPSDVDGPGNVETGEIASQA